MGVFVPSPAVSLVGHRVGVVVCSLSGCLLSGTYIGWEFLFVHIASVWIYNKYLTLLIILQVAEHR